MDEDTTEYGNLAMRAVEMASPSQQAGVAAEPAPTNERRRAVVVAATFTADLIEEPLQFWLHRLGIAADVKIAPYAQVLQELLNPRSSFARNAGGFNVLLIRLEDWIRDRMQAPLEENIQHLRRVTQELLAALRVLRGRTNAATLVFLCPISSGLSRIQAEPLQAIQHELERHFAQTPQLHCWTNELLMRLYPVSDYEDVLADRIGHIPYSAGYFAALATLFARRIAVLAKPPFKVIAVDCDNTLWKGICGEDGAHGIELTAAHLELQRLLVRQHDAGMLLCLCTKNNEADVRAVFESRPEMVLQWEHIICSRINWQPKSSNLQSIASELSLGLDSFIFVDDNALECEEIRTHCPSVLTLQFPQQDRAVRHFLDHVWAFDRIGVTAEAKKRTLQYQQNLARSRALQEATDLTKFLAALELQIDMAPLHQQHLMRAAELTQRTNQFNFTTVRRTAEEISAACQSGELDARVVHVRDRFGDYGMVGLVFWKRSSIALEVDTFLLSCRVLGRGVEHHIVNELGRIAHANRYANVVLRYRRTPRNEPARAFLHQSFGQFAISSKNDEEAAGDIVFVVPADYAECLGMDAAANVIPEEQGAVATVLREDSSAWHESAYRLTRVEDIVQEIARRSPKNDSGGSLDPLGPSNSTEAALVHIWSQVLRLPRVGLLDGFADLGGNSILAVQVVSRMSKELHVDLPLHVFFENPTVRELAQRVAQLVGSRSSNDEEDPLQAPILYQERESGHLAPATATQVHWWNYVKDHQGGTTQRLCYSALRLSGPLDEGLLRAALDDAVRRHGSLRTSFIWRDGQLLQQISSEGSCELEVIDLSGTGAAADAGQLLRLAEEFVRETVAIDRGPLFAARLLRVSEIERVLVLALEHIISDDFSNDLLCAQIMEYCGQREERQLPQRRAAFQFADYALWQQQTHASWLDRHAGYWRVHLAGAQRLALPMDRTLPRSRNPAYVVRKFAFGVARHASLAALAKRERLMLPVVMLAVYAVALSHWCNQRDVLLGFVSNGRYRPELEDVVGFIANVLHLRLIVDDADDVQTFLRKVLCELNMAYEHRDFDRVPDLMPDCAVQIAFNWIAIREASCSVGSLQVRPFAIEVPWPREFMAMFHDAPDGVAAHITYRADSLAGATIDRFGQLLIAVADGFTNDRFESLASLLEDVRCRPRGLPILS